MYARTLSFRDPRIHTTSPTDPTTKILCLPRKDTAARVAGAAILAVGAYLLNTKFDLLGKLALLSAAYPIAVSIAGAMLTLTVFAAVAARLTVPTTDKRANPANEHDQIAIIRERVLAKDGTEAAVQAKATEHVQRATIVDTVQQVGRAAAAVAQAIEAADHAKDAARAADGVERQLDYMRVVREEHVANAARIVAKVASEAKTEAETAQRIADEIAKATSAIEVEKVISTAIHAAQATQKAAAAARAMLNCLRLDSSWCAPPESMQAKAEETAIQAVEDAAQAAVDAANVAQQIATLTQTLAQATAVVDAAKLTAQAAIRANHALQRAIDQKDVRDWVLKPEVTIAQAAAGVATATAEVALAVAQAITARVAAERVVTRV